MRPVPRPLRSNRFRRHIAEWLGARIGRLAGQPVKLRVAEDRSRPINLPHEFPSFARLLLF